MVVVWGPLLAKHHITLQCDNLSLVNSINKGTARQALMMHVLHSLWLFTAYYDIALTATHILGITNTSADQFSINQQSLFVLLDPRASIPDYQTPSQHPYNR